MCAKELTSFNVTRKSPALYAVMLVIWFLVLGFFIPNLWRTFAGLNTILAMVLFVPFAVCLALFWFYGAYHLTFLVFSGIRKPDLKARMQALAKNMQSSPRIAIIYTTYNDFDREAASTCLNQDYPNYHVFILDVSTNPEKRKLVDAFQEEFASSTTLVRLEPKQGFKARSLNDTLKTAIGEEYEFFAVSDADNHWPADFLSGTVPYFLLDERIAFVQAKPTITELSEGKFAGDFEVAVDASWALHQHPRDRYGLMMLMGHSVIVRREAWEKAGGYPEIVQEDTAFTMSLRRHGYYGVFAPEVLCGEDFPEDFSRWRRRQFRLVQADTEILSTQMPAFLKNKGVSFLEKLDILARSIRIPSQCLTLPFLLLAFPLIPMANGQGLSTASIDGAFGPMITPRLITVTILLAAAPLYPFFVYLLKRNPLKMIPLLFHSITLHYTPLVVTLISFIVFILKGKAVFLVTGAKDGAAVQTQPVGTLRRLVQRIGVDSKMVISLDIVFTLILGWVGIASGSLLIVGVAFVLLISPVMRRWGWQNKIISVAVYLPLVLIIAGLATSLSGGIGAQSQYLALAVLSVLLY